jgi:hypothetical protein
MRAPDALDGTRADTDGFRHHSSSPMGRLGGRIGLGERAIMATVVLLHDRRATIEPGRPGVSE